MSWFNVTNINSPSDGCVVFAAVQAAICLFNVSPDTIVLKNNDIFDYARHVPGGQLACNYKEKFKDSMTVQEIQSVCFSFIS